MAFERDEDLYFEQGDDDDYPAPTRFYESKSEDEIPPPPPEDEESDEDIPPPPPEDESFEKKDITPSPKSKTSRVDAFLEYIQRRIKKDIGKGDRNLFLELYYLFKYISRSTYERSQEVANELGFKLTQEDSNEIYYAITNSARIASIVALNVEPPFYVVDKLSEGYFIENRTADYKNPPIDAKYEIPQLEVLVAYLVKVGKETIPERIKMWSKTLVADLSKWGKLSKADTLHHLHSFQEQWERILTDSFNRFRGTGDVPDRLSFARILQNLFAKRDGKLPLLSEKLLIADRKGEKYY